MSRGSTFAAIWRKTGLPSFAILSLGMGCTDHPSLFLRSSTNHAIRDILRNITQHFLPSQGMARLVGLVYWVHLVYLVYCVRPKKTRQTKQTRASTYLARSRRPFWVRHLEAILLDVPPFRPLARPLLTILLGRCLPIVKLRFVPSQNPQRLHR